MSGTGMSRSWHAEPDDVAGYAAGTVDATRAASIEAHLVTCAHCQGQISAVVDRSRLDEAWAGIVDTLDRPRPSLVERLLCRLGLRSDTARLLAATPSLQGSWLVAIALALAFAALAAETGTDRGLALFLMMAPLLPVAGVAAAFGFGLDPTWEIAAAAPVGGFRLLFLRASAVFVTTVGLAAVASLAVPGLSGSAVAWVVPALALTLASLALSTYTTPERAATVVAATWVTAVLAGVHETRDLLSAFGPRSQLGLAAVALVAALLLAQRRDNFEIRSHL